MAQVLVRDITSATVEKLKIRAQRNHRSLEAELRLVLTQAATGDFVRSESHTAADDRYAGLSAEIEQIRALFGDRKFSDSAELLRDDRDAR